MKYVKLILTVLLFGSGMFNLAQGQSLRRIISPEQPAWIIHIDVWNYADPQKIIDMVPEDVRPYVIFNIATSSSDEKSSNGPAIYDSWMKICAQNRVWTMIQCASGAFNRMPNTPEDVSAYEQYFKDYPNFLGFNFAEQYWGFDTDEGITFANRLQLFAKLLPLCKTYGGYLAVSFADTYHNANKMPVAYMKRDAALNAFLSKWPEHFLCFEKYTQKKNFLDIESQCLGAWLSGFAGQYGIRFDSSGWTGTDVKPDAQEGDTQYTIGVSEYVRAAGAIPIAEHIMLTGQTIMDGPELSWTECSKETNTTTVDGFTRRNWQWTPQWNNITLDLFRKVLDGTIRIMTKEEVMARTKVCVVSTASGISNEKYRTPAALFDGLYRNEKDYGGLQGREANHWLNNRWWMKSTGRYPTIPVMLNAGTLTDISNYVGNTTNKQALMNSLFPEEYSGDIYAGRHENGWITYNPYQYNDVTDVNGIRTMSANTLRATGSIPLQYNTCSSVQLDYAPYSLGIMKEYGDKITFYLSNYQTSGTMSEDIITINGAQEEPTCNWENRGTQLQVKVTTQWKNGIYTITVKHNGPLDLTIGCSGSATNRKTAYTAANVQMPALPPVYEGALQYEAELADYQQTTIRRSGYNQGRDGYQGQGFAEMTGNKSKLRFNMTLPETDYYLMTLCYEADGDGSVKVNEETLQLTKSNVWNTISVILQMNEGANTVIVENTGETKVILDYIRLECFKADDFTPDANGEYHVNLNSLMASGSLSINGTTGVITQQTADSRQGKMSLYLNHADFSEVTSLKVNYEGDGDLFRYLVISDNAGNSVNPTGYLGGFWSSKYNLNYIDYQLSDASRKVCKLEWVASNATSQTRTMTIHDILIKTSAVTSLKSSEWQREDSPVLYYNLQGQQTVCPTKGLHVIRMKNGTIQKRIIK